MERSYLIRYGLTGQVGRFVADNEAVFERGQSVVIASHRGTEIGTILLESPASAEPDARPTPPARLLREANPDDHQRARLALHDRENRFDTCQRVFRDGLWPIDLIDVEPLLDQGRTVLHYLGPHRLDTAGVLAALRAACNLDVMLQPVGRDLPDDEPEEAVEEDHGCGSCSSEGGGCGSKGGGCGTSGSGSCSDCGVKKLLTARR